METEYIIYNEQGDEVFRTKEIGQLHIWIEREAEYYHEYEVKTRTTIYKRH